MYQIGIDLGGTNISVGLVDDTMRILKKRKIPTQVPRSAKAIVQDAWALTQALIKEEGLSFSDIRWVGLGAPGSSNVQTGVLEFADNLFLENVPMVPLLEEAFHCPAFIENDANAAVYGEYLTGAAKNCHFVVLLTLGTGVGSGILLDGKIYRGCNDAGGECGHMVIRVGGRPCNCGRQGCFETYASATGLKKTTQEAMKKHPESQLWQLVQGDLEKVNGKTAFDGKRIHDAIATQVVEEYLADLGTGIVNIVNIFQPDILCLGGGISKEGDAIIKPLEALLIAQRYSRNARVQTVLRVAALGNDAGIIGAAMIGKLYAWKG